ncbi:GILT-like protein 1 [Teleopsis dalmanni]|uniref:GILT-like protein 1 n=1 Tax=Teleopsis dalmanni TaxID=139649 RepID=UPI0018CDB550|nr:GILT-like protein 1 [Teleopsis dalmanni]
MISSTRKRIFIILCIIAVICVLIRYMLFHDALLAPQPNYQRELGAPVLVMVYYEALCPDSKHFITKQLVPTYKAIAPLMEILLVPYGKAQTFTNADGTYRFDCQHGPVECQANTYHSCAIEVIEDAQARLDVVACMIRDNRLPKEALHRCAKQHNIDNIDLILKCYDSTNGGELLKLNGDATHALRPPVTFIPTITLDGSIGRQASILKNLQGEVCKIAADTDQGKELCNNV